MTRTKQITAALIAGVAILGLGAAPLTAGHFKELSVKHVLYGVSQFNAIDTADLDQLALYNPIHVTQVAALLVYRRADVFYGHDGEEFFFTSTEKTPSRSKCISDAWWSSLPPTPISGSSLPN